MGAPPGVIILYGATRQTMWGVTWRNAPAEGMGGGCGATRNRGMVVQRAISGGGVAQRTIGGKGGVAQRAMYGGWVAQRAI